MGKNKQKRIKAWCMDKYAYFDPDMKILGPKEAEKLTGKSVDYENNGAHMPWEYNGKPYKYRKLFARCPKCNRYLQLKCIIDGDGERCFKFPPHKKWIKEPQ